MRKEREGKEKERMGKEGREGTGGEGMEGEGKGGKGGKEEGKGCGPLTLSPGSASGLLHRHSISHTPLHHLEYHHSPLSTFITSLFYRPLYIGLLRV